MNLLGCAPCYLRLLGGARPKDRLVPPWERTNYRQRYRDGLRHWNIDQYTLRARLEDDEDEPFTKISCDICCTNKIGPRFGIVAETINERENHGKSD